MTEAEVKRNTALLEEYKKKTYEELNKMECKPNLTRLEIITLAIAKYEKKKKRDFVTGH